MSDTSNNIFDGLLTRAELAAQMHCTERTVFRYERAGMPFIAMGNHRLYKPEAVRSWILSHEQRPDPIRRGRPRKVAA